MIKNDKSGGLKYLVSEQHVVSPRKSNWVGTACPPCSLRLKEGSAQWQKPQHALRMQHRMEADEDGTQGRVARSDSPLFLLYYL